jgi:hypothetical protein
LEVSWKLPVSQKILQFVQSFKLVLQYPLNQ